MIIFLLMVFFFADPCAAADHDGSMEESANSFNRSSCEVVISYFLHIQPRMASNQFAIWIEDLDGNYVASVFATRYTALGGYKHRPLSLLEWRKVSDWDLKQTEYVDAVSGATPSSGNHQAVWDCRDARGNLVAPGRYIYKMEGNIFWENRVVWTGEIEIGHHGHKSEAAPEYIPERAHRKGILLQDVRAVYKPAPGP